MIKKAIGPLKSVICKKASQLMQTGTKQIWKGVPESLFKTFQARIMPRQEREAQLRADPLVDVRTLLDEMKQTHDE